ncbi:MAG: peptide-methionine (R)-S-oxide reductase MsrB [Lysobacterales bacterium]
MSERYPLTLSSEQWRQRLGPEAFAVLREQATERAGSSPLDREHRDGVYHCAGCAAALFDSRCKFDSGTGWPSFWQPLAGAVATRDDRKFFMTRTEVHCAHCGGHLGHVFADGPPPSGQRYCMNGVALAFQPGLEEQTIGPPASGQVARRDHGA